MKMITRSYTVRFLTPAFLGDADQNGAWRTPPFKALLRQWWRVAYVAGREPTEQLVEKMRDVEGRLFGNAWLDADHEDRLQSRSVGHCRSLVRIKLEASSGNEAWTSGTQRGVDQMKTGLETSYAWFGLIKRKDRDKRDLPDRTGLKPSGTEGERTLKIAVPEERWAEVESALRLINAFGQIGSRARTGWGAIQFDELQPFSSADIDRLCRDSQSCLAADWAHAFGRDEAPWIWESDEEFSDWEAAMSKIAQLRKEVRTSLKSTVNMRMLMGFAAEKARMPSPLRWRVFRVRAADKKSLKVRIFALPHRIPSSTGKDAMNGHAGTAWKTAVSVLDRSWLQRAY